MSSFTSGVARVPGWEEAVHADHGKHGHGSQQGAQLHYRSAPHEGAVALVSQDQADDHLHVGESENKQDPGQHLVEGGKPINISMTEWGVWGTQWRSH